ncbi:hypothetical protein UGMREWDR_CDS0153 [Aeromonas phage GomatiRiver_11]|nr:hypothetical protein OBDJBBDK_00145 [Aeromonas phage AhFM11]WKW84320.1 hypothetical protein UGMREWDR_CDS0153 [Aeromonas phage GomatiRiver_11]
MSNTNMKKMRFIDEANRQEFVRSSGSAWEANTDIANIIGLGIFHAIFDEYGDITQVYRGGNLLFGEDDYSPIFFVSDMKYLTETTEDEKPQLIDELRSQIKALEARIVELENE